MALFMRCLTSLPRLQILFLLEFQTTRLKPPNTISAYKQIQLGLYNHYLINSFCNNVYYFFNIIYIFCAPNQFTAVQFIVLCTFVLFLLCNRYKTTDFNEYQIATDLILCTFICYFKACFILNFCSSIHFYLDLIFLINLCFFIAFLFNLYLHSNQG